MLTSHRQAVGPNPRARAAFARLTIATAVIVITACIAPALAAADSGWSFRVEPSRLDFGVVPLTEISEQKTATVFIDGMAEMGVERVEAEGPSARAFEVSAACEGENFDFIRPCAVTVRFRPGRLGALGAGDHSATLALYREDGIPEIPSTERLPLPLVVTGTGTGALHPPRDLTLALIPGTVPFGAVKVGEFGERQLQLRNVSGGPINLKNVVELDHHTGPGSNPFTASLGAGTETCPPQLPAGGSCPITVRFNPTIVGQHDAELYVAGEREGQITQASLSGTAWTVRAKISGADPTETRLDFGSLPVDAGPSGARVVDLEVVGDSPLRVQQVGVEGPGAEAFSVQTGDCEDQEIAAGRPCHLLVRFHPIRVRSEKDALGRQEARLVLVVGDKRHDVGFTLLGEATAAQNPVELLGISPPPDALSGQVDVGSWPEDAGASPTEVRIGLRNPSRIPRELEGGVTDNTEDFRVDPDSWRACAQLDPYEQCEVVIRFDPTGTGVRSGTVVIKNQASTSQLTATATLVGTGTEATTVAATPPNHDFGGVDFRDRQRPPVKRTFKLAYGGNLTISLDAPQVVGSDGAPMYFAIERSDGGCTQGTTLGPANRSCTVTVSFDPRSAGLHTGEVLIDARATQTGAQQRLSLGLRGVGARLQLGESSHDFGDIEVGESSDWHSFALKNETSASVVVDGAFANGANAGDFEVDLDRRSCPKTIKPEEVCELQARFKPSAEGLRTATMRLTLSDPAAVRRRQARRRPATRRKRATRARSTGRKRSTHVRTPGRPRTAARLAIERKRAPRRARVRSTGSGGTIDIALTGRGLVIQENVTITPEEYDFGDRLVGRRESTAPVHLKLRNTGRGPIGFPRLDVDDFDRAFRVDTEDACLWLEEGDTCKVAVAFSPMRLGETEAQIALESLRGYLVTAKVKGNGTTTRTEDTRPSLTLGGAPLSEALDFGARFVGQTSFPSTLRIENPANPADPSAPATWPEHTAALDVLWVGVTGSDAEQFEIAGDTGCQWLASGATCEFGVLHRPTSEGVHEATVTVITSAGPLSADLIARAEFGEAFVPDDDDVLRNVTPPLVVPLTDENAVSVGSRLFSTTGTWAYEKARSEEEAKAVAEARKRARIAHARASKKQLRARAGGSSSETQVPEIRPESYATDLEFKWQWQWCFPKGDTDIACSDIQAADGPTYEIEEIPRNGQNASPIGIRVGVTARSRMGDTALAYSGVLALDGQGQALARRQRRSRSVQRQRTQSERRSAQRRRARNQRRSAGRRKTETRRRTAARHRAGRKRS
jgi:hypothetical protein